MTSRDASSSFTIGDWLGTIVTAGTALALAMFPVAGRSAAAMFRDFGGTLPLLTRLAISAWFPLVLAAAVVALLVVGLRAGPLSRRRAWIVGAFVLGCASLGLCIVAMYLPLFEVGAKVE